MNTENGRSMVEVIGVLAIIGVLTIGGMASFRSAMNKITANGIAGAIGDMSSEAGRLSYGKCIDQDDLDDDFEMPKCVASLKGAGNGQVKITFKTGDECQEIENAVSNTFGKCKWVKEGDHTYIYIPNRGSACKDEEDGECTKWQGGHSEANPCEDFKKATCF